MMKEGWEDERSPLLGLLLIDVVGDKIMSFLNLEDMKSLSETSRDALHLTRNCEGFLRRAKLDISKDGILGPTSLAVPFKWKHLSLDFTKRTPLEGNNEIDAILGSAESLHAYLTADDPKGEEEEVKECQLISDYLGHILRKTGNLTTLKLDEKVIYSIDQDLWDDEEFRAILGRLNCLHVYPHSYSWHWFLSVVAKRSGIVAQNFRKFCSLAPQLKRLTFNCRSFGDDQSWFDWIPDPESMTCLEHLELDVHIRWEELSKLGLLRLECPRLKSFKLSIDEHDNCLRTRMEGILTSFFSQQPQLPLEELDIWITESEISNHVKLIPLLTATLPDDMASRIKKLHLSNEGVATLREPWEWSFLEKMTQLRDVSIDNSQFYKQLKRGEKVGYAEDILWVLPSQIEKLSLMGFGGFFWRDDAEGLDPFRSFLCRFENLKELHVLRNSGTVNDAGLQSIISICPNLKALSLSGDQGLTNYGATGVDRESGKKTGVSLDDLSGLVSLRIGRCLNVNVEGLLPVINFRFLRSFDYEGNPDEDDNDNLDAKEFFCQIAKQNPSLERLALRTNKYSRYDVIDLKTEVRKVNRRIQSMSPSTVKFRYRDCRCEPDESTEEDEDDEFNEDVEDGLDEDENGEGVDGHVEFG